MDFARIEAVASSSGHIVDEPELKPMCDTTIVNGIALRRLN